MRLSLGAMCRLHFTTKTLELISGVVPVPLMRLNGIPNESVAEPDRPCKRKDLIGGIKKCIPEAVRDCRRFTWRGGLTATPTPTYHCRPGRY
jgi:hypothetical protein